MKISRIKAGNAIPVSFTICDGGSPVDMSTATEVRWTVRNERLGCQGMRLRVVDAGNPASLLIDTTEQDALGVYFVGVSYVMDERRRVVDAPAFELVAHTPAEACEDPENPVCICAKTEISDVGIRGIPAGGTPGQVLTKTGDADFESGWTTIEVPTKVSQLENDAQYTTEPWVENGYLSKSEAEALQPRITTTEDLALSPENVLSLTSKAKERLFIDLWNATGVGYCDAHYNEETGFYELNGIIDLTYEDALYIYAKGALSPGNVSSYYAGSKIRANLLNREMVILSDGLDVFLDCIAIECAAVGYMRLGARTFRNCVQLKSIQGLLYGTNLMTQDTFRGCANLVDLKFANLFYIIPNSRTMYIPDSPLISLSSIRSMTGTQTLDNPYTIVVHPDVYEKLLDPQNAEWHAIQQDAASRNIIFAIN